MGSLFLAIDIIEDSKRYVQYKNNTKKQIAYALAITVYQTFVPLSTLFTNIFSAFEFHP